MKVKDLLEADVVDFSAARSKKATSDMMGKLRGVASAVQKHQTYEQAANAEFAQFAEWMNNLKSRQRVFGFESLNDAFYFLVVDVSMPSWTPVKPSEKIKPGTGGYEAHVGEVKTQHAKIRKWYNALDTEAKRKFLTIVHNTDKIRNTLTSIQAQLRKLQQKWSEISKKEGLATSLDVFQSTSYIDTELRDDLEYLNHVDDIAQIIGL